MSRVKITDLGGDAFIIELDGEDILYIDPFHLEKKGRLQFAFYATEVDEVAMMVGVKRQDHDTLFDVWATDPDNVEGTESGMILNVPKPEEDEE